MQIKKLDDSCRVQELMKMPLKEAKEELMKVSISATNENILRNQLDKIGEYWWK